MLDGRHLKQPKKRARDFAFSGLITCGSCGCATVAEIKKGSYVYWAFTGLLKGILFSEELGW